MGVLENDYNHKVISSSITSTIIVALFAFMAVVFTTSSAVPSESGTKTGKLLGLKLIEITKTPAGEQGFRLSSQISLIGLTTILISAVIIGALIGLFRKKSISKS